MEDTMFSTDLNGSAWGRRRRGWATLFSFLLQCVCLALLMLAPVLFPHVLPRLNAAPPLISLLPSAPDPPPVDHIRSSSGPRTSERIGETLLQPTRIPTHAAMLDDHNVEPAPAFDTVCPTCAPGGMGSRDGLSVIAIVGPAPPPPPSVTHSRPVSVMMEGMLIRPVQPIYPPLAKNARIQGTVVLQAIISKQGMIEHLQALSGPPMLVPAALEAVRQWRYRPYVLNGEAVEVETQVTVNFVLSGS
jgi:protein TonB